jgi:hypothetical protein
MSAEAERWWRRRNDTAWPRADRMKEAGDALAVALEARDRRIAELEAGLRRIVNGVAEQHANDDPRHEGALREIKRLARGVVRGESSRDADHT